MNTMSMKASGLVVSMVNENYEELVLNVIPQWDDEELDCFKVSFTAFKDDYNTSRDFISVYTDEYELEDLLKELQIMSSLEDFVVNVYSYYHGDRDLLNYYRNLIHDVECGMFHMESEWG